MTELTNIAPVILYVDDEPANLDGFRFSFMFDFEIHTAQSALDGLSILQQYPVNVVVSDQRMPGMTGVDFLAQVAQQYPDIPRVMVTGFTDNDAIIAAINNSKIFYYIQKPWKVEELRIIIQHAFESYKLKQQNKLLIEKLRQAKEKAEEASLLKTAFLANLSHEVRTPLNAIVGFSNLLFNNDITLEQISSYQEYINQSSDDLLQMIENILNISQIELNQVIIHNEIINIPQTLTHIVHGLTKQYSNKKDIRLSIAPENDVVVLTDAQRLRQIIAHLIDNAFKYSDNTDVTVGYRVNNQAKEIEIFVADQGIGISAEYFDIIFEPFRKVNVSMAKIYRGLGLGLAISNGYSKLMGGRMSVQSQPGVGSCFSLFLPYKSH